MTKNSNLDQAERLRQRIDRIQDEDTEEVNTLPPRSKVHNEKKKKTKWKLKYPIIRLLALLFILIPVTFFSIYSYYKDKSEIDSDLVNNTTPTVYETIDLEEEDEKEIVTDENNKEENKDVSPTENTEKDTSIQDTDKPENAEKASDESTVVPKEDKESSNKVEQKKVKIIYHKVKPGETLYRIAMNYYKSQSGIQIIKNANNISGNEIESGTVLKIPM